MPSSSHPPVAVEQSMAPSSDSWDSPVGAIERFAGDPEFCQPFLVNCSLICFSLRPDFFRSEFAKVAFAVNH